MAKKTKHNKIKNSGILFELLTRKLTSDILNGVEESTAQRLIEKYFRNTTELGKEYVLYQALQNQRFNTVEKATDFITEVVNAHKKLRFTEIKKSKYALIKEIRDNFDLEDFFKPKIENYKVLASIYKIFQAKSLNEEVSPSDVVISKFTIIDNILGKFVPKVHEVDDELITEYSNEDEDIRLLSYKILVEKFNEKYSTLIPEQKHLIKEYINNISSINSLKAYVQSELPLIQNKLTERIKNIDDKVMKIKINEVINQLQLMKELKDYDDNHVMAVLNSYELVRELDEVIKNEKK